MTLGAHGPKAETLVTWKMVVRERTRFLVSFSLAVALGFCFHSGAGDPHIFETPYYSETEPLAHASLD
jgi:hypothetical protein